jgi:hypothetical protein
MVTTKSALVSSLTGPIQQTRYADGFNTTQNIVKTVGRSQGTDLREKADLTVRICMEKLNSGVLSLWNHSFVQPSVVVRQLHS